MEPKVDREDLEEIVDEAAHIEERERAKVDASEVRQILEELDVPGARLEQAQHAVAERRAAATKRTRRLVLAAVVSTLMVVAGVGLLRHHAVVAEAELAVTVAESHVVTNEGAVTRPLALSAKPEVTFEAVLAHAPRGDELELTCDWTGPHGELEHQNRWRTKAIDRDVWPTHCKRSFGTSDAPGGRTVSLKQGDRELAKGEFAVE